MGELEKGGILTAFSFAGRLERGYGRVRGRREKVGGNRNEE